MTTPTAPQLDRLYVLYGSEVSYFTGKVRPAFRYKRVPFAEALATPEAYREVIRPRTGLAFIPVVVTPEDGTWQDTSEILDNLEAAYPSPALYPATPLQRVAAFLIETYADEFLVLPGLHYRWNFQDSIVKARADFAATSGDPVGAGKLADRMSGALQIVGVTTETVPAVEAHTEELFRALDAHFREHPYILGGKPSLADCALMGPFYPHFYLDAAPGRLIRSLAPAVCHWIERMNHPNPSERGEWLPNDAIAPTLRPVLELIGRDAGPVLLDNVRDFETWADSQPAGEHEPPRGIGMHTSSLRGIAMQRFTSSYTSWMLQRILDAYGSLTAASREYVDGQVRGTGCEALLASSIRHRVTKRNFRLFFTKS